MRHPAIKGQNGTCSRAERQRQVQRVGGAQWDVSGREKKTFGFASALATQ